MNLILIALPTSCVKNALKLNQKTRKKKKKQQKSVALLFIFPLNSQRKDLPLWSFFFCYQSFCSCSVDNEEELGTGLGMLEPVAGLCSFFRVTIISAKLGLNFESLINKTKKATRYISQIIRGRNYKKASKIQDYVN